MSFQLRITDRSLTQTALVGLQGSLSRLADLQQQLSGGKSISRPSDNPTGAVAAMQIRAEIRTQDQYARNAGDGLGWLGTIDSTLTDAMDQIQRARDLTLQGMSGGSNSTGNNDALASEIDNIRQSLLQSANTQYLGRPVFGGTTAGTVAYDGTATYAGDSTQITRTVGDNTKIQVNAVGSNIFGTGTGQLFTVLASISGDMKSNPAALAQDLKDLDVASGRIQATLSDVGARYNRIQDMQTAANTRSDDLKSQLSDIEDVDLPKTITELQMQQVAYQAALAATAKVIQPSLVDFLK
jgi:flagellar hook-associated protein 3 FlgL